MWELLPAGAAADAEAEPTAAAVEVDASVEIADTVEGDLGPQGELSRLGPETGWQIWMLLRLAMYAPEEILRAEVVMDGGCRLQLMMQPPADQVDAEAGNGKQRL